jgi:signal peptidase I
VPALRRVLAVVLLLLVVLLGRAFVAEPVRISSDSMSPTLLRGDVVLVDRRDLDEIELRRGDLVTFANPQTGEESLKRVVALPGDTVATVDAILQVNDEPVDEPYVDFSDWEGIFNARVDVPAGSVFLMGDNRGDSVDSRDYGAVPVDRLEGRVLVRLWPPVRVGAEEPQPPRP